MRPTRAVLVCAAVLTPLLGCAEDGRSPGRDTIPPGTEGAEAEIAILGEGVVSTQAPEFGASLTPDGRTLYFNRASGDRQELRIMVAHRTEAGWSEPRVASFSGTHRDLDAFVAPDGDRVWFNSDRPPPKDGSRGFDIWYVERTRSGWGPAVNPPLPLNSDSLEIFVSANREGVLYFTSSRAGPLQVYRAAPEAASDGRWSRPEPLVFGSLRGAGNPLVGPDGGFLVLTAPGPDGSTDLFVTCRREDGWSEPIHLPRPINSSYMDFAPGLDPADGSLLFTSERPGMAGPQPDSVRPPGDLYRSSLRPAELCGSGPRAREPS